MSYVLSTLPKARFSLVTSKESPTALHKTVDPLRQRHNRSTTLYNVEDQTGNVSQEDRVGLLGPNPVPVLEHLELHAHPSTPSDALVSPRGSRFLTPPPP